jgi:DNA processing protein
MSTISRWMALERADGIGPAHLKEIRLSLEHKGLAITDLFELSAEEIINEFPFPEKIALSIAGARKALGRIEEDYFQIIDRGFDVVPFFSPFYPARLAELLGNTAPPLLYLLGNPGILGLRGVALLGDKFVSDKGAEIAYTAARELSLHQVTTISGYAAGADMIAHRSALQNNGATVAVLPQGILKFRLHPSLEDVFDMDRIAVISPFYPTREANRFNAFIRNKIACALARAVFIIEAPAEGGIFEAGKSAVKLGVPLFTVQYATCPKNALGNNALIEELGATPVRGRFTNDLLVPNMEKILAAAKFN